MPEIPADMIEPSPANNSTEKPKQKLNEHGKTKLEKQQQEQSNHINNASIHQQKSLVK